jgi:hypothetical protein
VLIARHEPCVLRHVMNRQSPPVPSARVRVRPVSGERVVEAHLTLLHRARNHFHLVALMRGG